MIGELGVVAGTVVVVLLIVFLRLTRERRYRRLRVGFFIERDRFEEEPEEEPDVDDVRRRIDTDR